jgi:NitT/TauT family transport system substrate-binding protein
MRFVIGVAALVCALGLFEPASAEGQSAANPQGVVRIEVPNAHNLQFFTLWVALGAHYFEQEGLQPRIIPASGPRSTGELLFRGEADVALLPPPMYLGMMAEQKPIALFASLLANEPINLVLQKDVAAARGFSANSSLRERLLALKGLKVGLAREVGPRLRALYASVGLDADKELRLVTVLGPNQVRTFAAREVDALFAHTPYLETVLVQHQAVLVVDTSGGEVPVLADGQIHALATTRALAMSKPDMMVAVARAIHRAQRLIHSDAKAAVDAIIASGAALQDRRFVEQFVAVYGPAVPATPSISLPGIERANTLYPAHPRHPDFTRVRMLDFVAPMIAQRAIEPTR